MKTVLCNPGGTVKWVRDAVANDSDKSFVVPAGKIWALNAVVAMLVATATVGTRVLSVCITDGTNVLYNCNGCAIAASQTGTLELHLGGGYFVANAAKQVFAVGTISAGTQNSVAAMFLPAGYVVHVLDLGAIDAAADDMTVVLHYTEYDV